MEKSAEPDRAILKRIAEALDVPVERFFSDSLTANADECLYLWSRIRTAEGRLRALEALRSIADEDSA
jgi:transcriptional regulator with XRE-family HTH domain